MLLRDGELFAHLPGAKGLKLRNGELYNVLYSLVIDYISPVISIISINTYRISAQPGKNRCTVTFKANEDLAAWELRAGGEGAGQGTLVESGGSLSAGTTVEAYIDYNELPYEAEWRINIYAKDLAGNWTPYDDSREE